MENVIVKRDKSGRVILSENWRAFGEIGYAGDPPTWGHSALAVGREGLPSLSTRIAKDRPRKEEEFKVLLQRRMMQKMDRDRK